MRIPDDNNTAIKETLNFVDDLSSAVNHKLKMTADFDKVCICGMGASAIGGDLLVDLMAQSSDLPITVVRFQSIPHWVNEKTFVIVCSYSGNTRETILMYEQAVKRGCQIVAITAGGELKKKCIEDEKILISLREGVQPRNSLGLMIGYMANVMEALGVAKCRTEMKELIPSLNELNEEIGFKNQDSRAKEIAKKIYGSIPVIYSTSGIIGSAVRWKTQINENSKMLAFNGAIPEFNHNEIVGWSESVVKFNCRPVFLYEEDAPEIMKAMANAAIETLKSFGVDSLVVPIRGKTVMERSLRAVMLGDYVSLYLAFMNDVDPIEVTSIVSFKEKVSRRMSLKKKSARKKDSA